MKSVGHAWVGLKAIQRIRSLSKNFNTYHRKQAKAFIRFFDNHRDAFVKGSWFPDSVISDNLAGGHTYKMEPATNDMDLDEVTKIKNRTPDHLSSKTLISTQRAFNQKVRIKHGYNLPDRCEALGHAIRDMLRIQKKEPKGSDIIFSDDQITLYFLMLSHYLADAHVPPHSDARDFYTPSKVHPDLESHWDKEIKKYYEFDKKRKVFNYDSHGDPEIFKGKENAFKNSFLSDALDLLDRRKWNPASKNILGKGNRKIYDYLKGVCFVSYLVSWEFIPEMTQAKYNRLQILTDPNYADMLRKVSIHSIADAIDSIALVWLLTWESHNKLEEDIKKKKKAIKRQGGNIPRQ